MLAANGSRVITTTARVNVAGVFGRNSFRFNVVLWPCLTSSRYDGCKSKFSRNFFVDVQTCEALCLDSIEHIPDVHQGSGLERTPVNVWGAEQIARKDVLRRKKNECLIPLPASCVDPFDLNYMQLCGQGEWRERAFYNITTGLCELFW